MRRTFYELLDNMEFDVYEEYKTLLNLFFEEMSNGYSLCEHIELCKFRRFPFRGRFASIRDMMEELDLNIISCEIEDLLVFCEFLLAFLADEPDDKLSIFYNQTKTIFENIQHILNKTNHKAVKDPKHESRYIIVENNKSAMLAAEMVEDENVAFDLLEYNHIGISGHLEEKHKILFSIGKYIEPILNSNVLEHSGYSALQSDIGFLLNNFHIRHNNKEGRKANDYIASISDDELEKWYDKAYSFIISGILINENIETKKEINDLKKQYTFK